ncbi:MAG: aldehyde dehydrogenase family protein, partial [Bacteroidia bacterium]
KGLFDEREVAFVFGDAEVAKEVLSMPFHHIFFTGSPQVGKSVMQAASRHLTSVTLELGGKSPVFVHDSFDIATAARKIAWAKTMNCGQTCIAPDYVLIPEGSTELFVQAYERAIKDFYNPQGKGIDKSVDYSRLIHRKHFQRLKSLLETDIQAGAKVLSGGNMNENDLFIEPILVSNMQSSMGLMREEIFGPILPICTYRNITAAIAQVNELERPLSLYIFSNNHKITEQILVNTTSGGVAINELMVTSVNPALPFGGVNHSGMGRSNGQSGFVSFSNEKGIVRRRWGTFSPIFPPYKPWLVRMLRKISSW